MRSAWDGLWNRLSAFSNVSRLSSRLASSVVLTTPPRTRGGMIAPMLGGTLLTIDHSFPVYASIGIFILGGLCVIMLKEREGARGGQRILAH